MIALLFVLFFSKNKKLHKILEEKNSAIANINAQFIKLQNEITASSCGISRGVNRLGDRPEGYNVRKAKRRHLQVQGER